MSDEQTLLAVIAAIYLADCIFWIPRKGLGFTRWLGRFWTIREPSTTVGNERGGIGFANPLPPLGLAVRGVGWTISISEGGIFSYTAAGFNAGGRPAQKAVFWAWEEIKSVAHDAKKVIINGEHFATAVSEYSCQWMAREIAKLQKLGEKKRASEITEAVIDSCDAAAVTRRVEGFLKQTSTLRYLCNWLLIFLFGACPYLVWRLGMVGAIWPVVIGIYLQTVVIALVFSKLHRKLYPSDSEQIFKPFLTMLLAAPSAIRAQDYLGRPLLESFHPLAVAKALSTEKALGAYAGGVIRDLHFPRMPIVPTGSSDAATETEKAFRELLLKGLKQKLALDETRWLKAPVRSEENHTAYCPRCLQQFTAVATDCPDCGGRELMKF